MLGWYEKGWDSLSYFLKICVYTLIDPCTYMYVYMRTHVVEEGVDALDVGEEA